MTQEQIEQAANEYRYNEHHGTGHYTDIQIEDIKYFAYLQGADSRQPEIDALAAENERLQKDIAEGLKREEITRKVIEGKRQEIDRLDRELNAVHICLTDMYEYKYNNERDRIGRIHACLDEIGK